MKYKLTILLIALASLGGTGCNTHTDATTHTLPQHATDIDIHKDYDQFYYKGENDTILTDEELQKQYNHYISLAWKAKLEGSLIDVLRNFEKAIQLNDSIQKITQTETIYIQDYQEVKNENSQLKQLHQWLLAIGVFLAVILIPAGSFFYIQRKKKKQQATAEQKETRPTPSKQQKLRVATFKESELYHKITQAAKDDSINISPVSQPVLWVSIQENLDILYSDFTKRLMEACPDLSETEQQICWLSKLDIQPSGIARILKLSRQAITNARTRIIKKIPQKEGQSTNFTLFIEKF